MPSKKTFSKCRRKIVNKTRWYVPATSFNAIIKSLPAKSNAEKADEGGHEEKKGISHLPDEDGLLLSDPQP